MIRHIILGPPEHGVTRHALALAGADTSTLPDVGPGASALRDELAGAAANGVEVHMHLTDHLLGNDHEGIERAVDVLAESPVRVHVTLHDIPQPEEGEARFARRSEVYRRIVELTASVQVCSNHERSLLEKICGRGDCTVVPLPIDVRVGAAEAGPQPASVEASDAADTALENMALENTALENTANDAVGAVGVLGFVHPGKNPHRALAVAAECGRDIVFLGALAEGHEDMADRLQVEADNAGIGLTITGHLTEEEMDAAIAAVSVPLAPYRHISASGSIGRWIASGRRPVVLRTPWAEELKERAPWALDVVDDEDLPAAVRGSLDDATRTWIGTVGTGLTTTDEAREMQARALREASAPRPSMPAREPHAPEHGS